MNKYLEKIAEMQEQDNHFWRNAAIGGATLGVAAGGALLARKGLAKLRTPKSTHPTQPTPIPENFSSRSPAHKELHDDLENLRKEVLNYHVTLQGNAQRIPWQIEGALHSKYPKVLARPLTPEKYLDTWDYGKREVMSDYIRHHKIPMKSPEH